MNRSQTGKKLPSMDLPSATSTHCSLNIDRYAKTHRRGFFTRGAHFFSLFIFPLCLCLFPLTACDTHIIARQRNDQQQSKGTSTSAAITTSSTPAARRRPIGSHSIAWTQFPVRRVRRNPASRRSIPCRAYCLPRTCCYRAPTWHEGKILLCILIT